jgi:16S rRNA (uracil1498-N3)-methyltransferase
MPRLYVPAEKLQGARATLDADAHRHLIKVLRLAPGATVHVFDGAGTEIESRIESVGRASLEITLGNRRRIPAPACTITLLQCLPRGERMDLIVQKTAELGVARIMPVRSARGMVKPAEHQRRRWQTIAEEAARQSGRADVPEILECVSFGPALEMASPTGTDTEVSRFVLWEGEHEKSLPRALAAGPRAVVMLVGPEGGFTPAEVDQATRAGFESVGLGPRILRTETAAIVAVALAQAAAGGLGDTQGITQ